MKRLIIAAALFATLGANASTHILHTIYQCGNHVVDKHAMKTDGEAHWHTTDKATTNGIVVYNGSSLDILIMEHLITTQDFIILMDLCLLPLYLIIHQRIQMTVERTFINALSTPPKRLFNNEAFPVQMYQNSREQLTHTGRAIRRLEVHPYGNLSERYQKWLERDTQALRAIRKLNDE